MKSVIITSNITASNIPITHYNVGDIYHNVVPYRHDPKWYYEVPHLAEKGPYVGGEKIFWICKEHCKIYETIPKEFFEI